MNPIELLDEAWLLRPSVSFVRVDEDVYDFFQSSTRRNVRMKLLPSFANLVRSLDGSIKLRELISDDREPAHFAGFIVRLAERCLVETRDFRDRVDRSPWRRALSFLGDYHPYNVVLKEFERIRSAKVLIMGAGAVGSWTAIQLANMGVRRFALVDDDLVEESNLNRSFFFPEDVGTLKVSSICKQLKSISGDVEVSEFPVRVQGPKDLWNIVSEFEPDVVVNAADSPSVDLTSLWVDECCQRMKKPYVVAGGYNMHLSLIGMTVLPSETACVRCSAITLREQEDESLRGVQRLWRPKRNLGSLAPLTGMTSSFCASETLRVLLRSNSIRPAMLNRRGEFNFLSNEITFVDLPPRHECGCVQ